MGERPLVSADRPRDAPKMLRAVESVVLHEDSTDPVVHRFDDLLCEIAALRDLAARTSHSRVTARAIDAQIQAVISARRAGHCRRKVDIDLLLRVQKALTHEILRRDSARRCLSRLQDALKPPTPTFVERRATFERHLRFFGFEYACERVLAEVGDHQPSIDDLATDFVRNLHVVWPEKKDEFTTRLTTKAGRQLLCAAIEDLSHQGRRPPRKGPSPLDELLKHLGIWVSKAALKSARRRARKPG